MKDILHQPGVKFGLIAGVFFCLLLFVLHSIDAATFVGGWRYLGWAVMLAMGFLAGVSELKANNDVLKFPRAITVIFTVFLITDFFAVATEYAIYNAFDTDLHKEVKEVQLQRTRDWMNKIGAVIDYAEGDIEENLQEVENADFNFYLSDAGLKFLTGAAINFFFALLLGIIVRKEPKEES